MSILRWAVENRNTDPISTEKEELIKIRINNEYDRPPELADNSVSIVMLNTGARNRLVAIEERQDKVRETGEKRLANVELIRQMNRDVGFYIFKVLCFFSLSQQLVHLAQPTLIVFAKQTIQADVYLNSLIWNLE
jgi:hypothetical protein